MNSNTIIIDCDGVLTDGALTIDRRGEKMFKRFHTRDVRAMRELVYNGFELLIVTADDWPGIYHFADKVGAEVKICRDKTEATLHRRIVAAIGDDAWDVSMLQAVAAEGGKTFCPADADQFVLDLPFITKLKTNGGQGVIAEVIHHLLPEPTWFNATPKPANLIPA
jgi:3-deoxy-D-manno-octulosonate 8-phosphate phosphatase KdsC-like HAD superfamily phosphatase